MAIKITLEDGTVIEGSVEEVKELSDVLGVGVGEEVDEISRDFKVGDKVILDAGGHDNAWPLRGFHNGEEYEIKDLTPIHDKEGVLRIVKEYGIGGYALPSQLRHANTKSEIEEGDIVFVSEDCPDPEAGGYYEVLNKPYGDSGGGNVDLTNGNIVLGKHATVVVKKADRLDA